MNKDKFQSLGKLYLTSNAFGLADGALKAEAHQLLSTLFVAERLGMSLSRAALISVDGERLSSLVRLSTVDFTNNMDKEIGFPLNSAPNYKKLTPLFVDKFLDLTNAWFNEQTYLMSDLELKEALDLVSKRKFTHSLRAMESYGFSFIEGNNDFLKVKSKIGQLVTIKNNKYLGCSYEIEKGIN